MMILMSQTERDPVTVIACVKYLFCILEKFAASIHSQIAGLFFFY